MTHSYLKLVSPVDPLSFSVANTIEGEMLEEGILQPNPILYQLDHRQPRHVLGHEVGAGAPCLQCEDKCPGFQLHFWRKICVNCLCGKAEHDIRDQDDHGLHFVGKLFDR